MNARLQRAFVVVPLATAVAVINRPDRHYRFVIASNPGRRNLTNAALRMVNTLILFGLLLLSPLKPQQTLPIDLG